MQNETLFPALQRVYPTLTGTPFVEQARVKADDVVPAAAAAGRHDPPSSSCEARGMQADSTATLFLASAVGRLGPVLGVILLLWGLIAWSAGWLGAIAG
ncbi:MAG TPA: hypothetical protein VKZ94_01890 [Advenella sp.]|nr:hypothetical protein [Advenella sp.]